MQTHQLTIHIEAGSSQEAQEIVSALLDIKKALTKDDLMLFSKAIKKKPSLVQKAKMFI